MNKITMVATLLATFVPMAAHADPPPQMAEVMPLIGSWSGTGTITAGGTSSQVRATYVCEASSGGLGVKCHGEMTGFAALDPYVWDDLWGYSAGDGLFHWYTVTNAGETHDHRGLIQDGHAYLQFDGPQGGMLFSERVTIDFTAKKLTILSDVSVGGKPAESVQLTFSPARS